MSRTERTASGTQEIRISIKHDPEVQDWVRQAKAQHISVPLFALQAIREKIASAAAISSILQEMSNKMEQMERTLREITAQGMRLSAESAPDPTTFVRNPAPDYDAAAAELFGNSEGVGWE